MHTHPYVSSQLARERQRDKLARADQRRLARQLRDLARTSRRAESAGWRTIRVLKRLRPAALPS